MPNNEISEICFPNNLDNFLELSATPELVTEQQLEQYRMNDKVNHRYYHYNMHSYKAHIAIVFSLEILPDVLFLD